MIEGKILFEKQKSAEISLYKEAEKIQERLLYETRANKEKALYESFVKNTGIKIGTVISINGHLRKIESVSFGYRDYAVIEAFKQKKNGEWYQYANTLYQFDFDYFEIVETGVNND